FQQMLVDLNDVMVPVISHGLLIMRKLIEKRSPPVEKYRNLLLKICRYNVKHEDSYVYLNAIYALSALTTMYHEEFLQILMDDYVEVDRGIGSVDYLKVDENQIRVIDVKLKLGEALLRVVTRLGSSAIAYKNKLFSTLVKVSRNDYPTVRSSAITNLAQLCKLLGFSLSSNVNEIFNSLKCMLKYDKSVEVRRAAALATHQILQGTSKDTLRILGDVLAEFYRLLKNVYYIEKDDVVKIHIQHSIEKLNDIMKNFLFPTPTLQKNIFIL
ncbi:hypothetical protein HELRODRAFT_123132, partial [Helobdella robusta]|uniref:Uncharacterized protein n=1 Tax=Helobdella robusta TaxID=6412 RepID=T1EGX0_HELRO